MKKVIATKNAPAAIGPYSQAVQVGNMLFASGQLGLDPATGNFLFFRGIHDLLHTSLKFFLQVLCVKAFRRHLHIFDLHRFRYDLPGF